MRPHHSPQSDPGGLLPDAVAKVVTLIADLLGAMVCGLTGPRKPWRERAADWVYCGAMAVCATPVPRRSPFSGT